MCRTGELTGQRFELTGETVIGRDDKNQLVIATASRTLATRSARIYPRAGAFWIELVKGGDAITVDGNPLSGEAALDRMHVIGIAGSDFVFTRTATAPAGAPVAAAPPAPAPASPPAPAPPAAPPAPAPRAAPPKAPTPPVAEEGHTVVDMMAFGALPDFKRAAAPTPSAAPSPAEPATPVMREPGATVVDLQAFGALPEFVKPLPKAPPAHAAPSVAPAAAPPAPAPPAPAQKTPLPTPAPALPAPITTEDSDRTMVFVPPPEEPPYELAVQLSGKGPNTFALKRGDNIVGRGEGCDIVVPDPEMWLSRKHVNVRVGPDEITLIDLKGKNGTFVQGQRIETVVLTPGSSFVLGPHLEFKLRKR